MKEDDFNFESWESDDFIKLINRFEDMIKTDNFIYFDSDELEDIIDYYLNTEQIKQCSIAIKIALTQYPDNEIFLIQKALFLQLTNDTGNALKILESLFKQNPENIDVLSAMGDILHQQGKYNPAIKKYEKALSLTKDNEEKETILEQLLATLDEAGLHNKMILYFKSLLEINSNNNFAISGIANCYILLEKEEEGIVYFNNLTDTIPYNTLVWFCLGNLYLCLNLYEKAIETYDFALAIEPTFISALIKKGVSYSSLNNDDEAIAVFEEIIKIDEQESMAYNHLGYCYFAKKNYNDAIKYFSKAIFYNKEMTDAHLGLVYCYIEQDKYKIALTHINKIIELNADTDDIWFFKAFIEEELNENEEADKSYRKSLELNPYNEMRWISYSEFHIDNFDELNSAILILLEAIEYLSKSYIIMYRLAAYYFEKGSYNEGSKWLHNALSINKENLKTMFEYNSSLEDDPKINSIINQYL